MCGYLCLFTRSRQVSFEGEFCGLGQRGSLGGEEQVSESEGSNQTKSERKGLQCLFRITSFPTNQEGPEEECRVRDLHLIEFEIGDHQTGAS